MTNDNRIIEEAIRLVDEGHKVVLPVKGWSMLPFIVGGRDSVQLVQPKDFGLGDIVLAWVIPGRYVIHRIINIEGDNVTLMGDGNIAGTEQCSLSDVKAKATHAVGPDERKRALYSRKMRFAAKLWCWLLPIRRYLLYIYRKL